MSHAGIDSARASAGDKAAPGALRVTTRDPAHLTTELGHVYHDAQVAPPPRSVGIDVRFQEYELPGLWFARFQISTATMVLPENPFYSVLVSTSGKVISRLAGQEAITDGHQCVVASAGADASVDYLDHCRATSLRFDRQLVHDELAHTLGRIPAIPLRFDINPPLETLQTLQSIIAMLDSDLDDQHLITYDPVAHHLSRMAVSSLLHSVPSNYTDELTAPPGFTGPRPIRAAIEALEGDPLRFATVGDIAREVSLSVRALEDGFGRHLGTTPMRYRKLVRLERARRELLNSTVDDTTATATAVRWGYFNYGRFAVEYRRAFGSTPHEDLRRTSPP